MRCHAHCVVLGFLAQTETSCGHLVLDYLAALLLPVAVCKWTVTHAMSAQSITERDSWCTVWSLLTWQHVAATAFFCTASMPSRHGSHSIVGSYARVSFVLPAWHTLFCTAGRLTADAHHVQPQAQHG